MPQKITFRLPDTPEGQAVAEWLDGLPWGARNRAIVSALYAAATGRQGQESAPARPVQAAVDLYAIRQVVEAAVYTALSRTGQPAEKEEVQETVDDILADFDKSVIL